MARKSKARAVATVRLLRAVRTLRFQNEQLRAQLAAHHKNLPELLGLPELPHRPCGTERAPPELLVAVNERLLIAALAAQALSDEQAVQIESLTHTSQRDALTGTPTRAVMMDRIDNAISMARRHALRVALLFVDLDNFKSINDELGHLAGDTVLQLVARRLESGVRDSDTVSRHGGDEFLVLLAELSATLDAAAIATQMISAVAAPVSIAGRTLAISVSMGIAVYPDDGGCATTLIAKADEAMYRSKKRKHGSFMFYDGPLNMPVGDGP